MAAETLPSMGTPEAFIPHSLVILATGVQVLFVS